VRCPLCLDEELIAHIRDGVQVERCARCRGLWLDRGELDKLLDLAAARAPRPDPATPARTEPPRPVADRRPADVEPWHDRDRRDDRDRWDDRPDPRRRRRRGALADLLEDVFEGFD